MQMSKQKSSIVTAVKKECLESRPSSDIQTTKNISITLFISMYFHFIVFNFSYLAILYIFNKFYFAVQCFMTACL